MVARGLRPTLVLNMKAVTTVVDSVVLHTFMRW